MLTRIALYATLGCLLDAVGLEFSTVGFWCVLGLFWAVEHLARVETVEQIWEEVEALRNRKDNGNG